MLNVAVIRSVAYYLDQVAQSRADYYVGRGEAPGRWRGALAATIGLSGTVDPEALRALLEGRNPRTGEAFLASRIDQGKSTPATAVPDGATMSVAVAATALGVSPRTVRRWAAAGSAVWSEAQSDTPGAELNTPGDVLARLIELGSPSVQEGASCLLVRPATGRRRRIEIPTEEVERLRAAHRGPSSRQGYDVVLRPAKGWSVLWAVGPPELRRELSRIHHHAVDDALRYLEDTAARGRATVSWRGRRVRVRARGDGFVAACFDHRESRAGDPLLHTHCLIANVTRLPNGHLGALEASGLFRQQRAADAVYRATFLRLATERLGIRPAAGDDPFPEPEGVPRPVIEHFSKRSEEIGQEAARHGSASAAVRQLAALATRRAKEVAARSEDLHGRWRDEALAIGFGPAEIAACLDLPRVAPPTAEDLQRLAAALAAPDGLTEKAATFFRGDVVRALADALPGSMTGPEIVAEADAFLTSQAVIQVREHRPGRARGRVLDGGGVVDDVAVCRFSVPELADAEARLIQAAGRQSGPVLDDSATEFALGTFGHLSNEQADMVRAVCRSTALLRPVVGLPGSGKTTATAALVAAYQRAGIPVRGCAVTATAAAELAQRTGLLSCDTLARTLLDLQEPGEGLPPGTIVIADEASMLPTRSLDRLVAHVQAADGAVVLVGDPHQHPAVGPGSFYSWLSTRREVPTLTGNLRQVGPGASIEQEAAAALRSGDIARSIDLREGAGLLTRAASPAELHERLVTDWHQAWATARDPMIAAANDTRRRLNAAARALLDEAGVLHGPVWTTAGGSEFRAGDWVVARHNDRRLRAVNETHFWVRNGACGEIATVDPDSGEIVVDFVGPDGVTHRVRLPAAYVETHLEHGYAVTDYGVQGRTLSRSLAVLEEASTMAGAYVATTRGQIENRLYVTDGRQLDHENLDVSHGLPLVQAPTVKELAARVATRRPEGMLHERDRNVREAAGLAKAADLATLQHLLRELDLALDAVPNDPSPALASALAARQRLVDSAHDAKPGPAEIATRLAQLDTSIDRLQRRHKAWTSALTSGHKALRRREVVIDAIAIRTTAERLSSERTRSP